MKLTIKEKKELAESVIAELLATNDGATRSAAWEVLQDAIRKDPYSFACDLAAAQKEVQRTMPKEGTLEHLFVMKMLEKPDGEGVTHLDFIGTGINESNIGEVVNRLNTGFYESDDPEHMALVNGMKAEILSASGLPN